jgi:hypothetical protein
MLSVGDTQARPDRVLGGLHKVKIRVWELSIAGSAPRTAPTASQATDAEVRLQREALAQHYSALLGHADAVFMLYSTARSATLDSCTGYWRRCLKRALREP